MAFAADWLALREPADHAARDPWLLAAAVDAAGPAPLVLDLGCGTGSTRRAFGDALGRDARWRFLDSDPALLDRASASAGQDDETVRHDLSRIDTLPLDGVTLVTASALLDLASADWIRRLAAALAARKLPFYAALTFDGTMRWTPPLPEDPDVVDRFNGHMVADKGLGPALGPAAAAEAGVIFRNAGYVVSEAQSPWRLGSGETALQRAFLDGVAGAAREAGMAAAPAWKAARDEAIPATEAEIGHRDMFARPPDSA